MTSAEEAKSLLREAKDKVNCDPENHHRDFVLADERDDPEEELEFQKVEFQSNIHTAIATVLIEQLQRYISDVDSGDEDSSDEDETEPIREITPYNVGNYEKSPSPVQYLPEDEISRLSVFRSALNDVTVNEKTDFRNPDDIKLQAFRVTSPLQPELVAFKKFTKNQIIGSNFEVKIVSQIPVASRFTGDEDGDEPIEYNAIDEDPVALPNEFDALYYDGVMFVFNPGKFEDMFDYFEEYKRDADDVFEYIEDSELQIQEFDRVKSIIKNSRNSLRKMRKIRNRGRYNDLDRSKAEGLISEWDLDIYVSTDEDGEWQIKIPDFRKVGDVLRLLDDNLVVSGMDLVEDLDDKHKYLVTGSQESR